MAIHVHETTITLDADGNSTPDAEAGLPPSRLAGVMLTGDTATVDLGSLGRSPFTGVCQDGVFHATNASSDNWPVVGNTIIDISGGTAGKEVEVALFYDL